MIFSWRPDLFLCSRACPIFNISNPDNSWAARYIDTKFVTPVKQSQSFNCDYFHDNYRRSNAGRVTSAREIEIDGLIKFSRNRRNGTKQEKHSGKGIAIAFTTALFLNFSVKSLSRKVVQKFWGEVSVLSLPLMLIIINNSGRFRRLLDNVMLPHRQPINDDVGILITEMRCHSDTEKLPFKRTQLIQKVVFRTTK